MIPSRSGNSATSPATRSAIEPAASNGPDVSAAASRSATARAAPRSRSTPGMETLPSSAVSPSTLPDRLNPSSPNLASTVADRGIRPPPPPSSTCGNARRG